MARILITGANGFTGRYLVDRLAPEGHELIALAHDAREQSSPLVARTLVADLRDLANLRAVIAEVRPDRVVHLAAIANVAHGLANMAGNATAQKYTGLAVDASRAATALRGMGGGAPAAPAGVPPG